MITIGLFIVTFIVSILMLIRIFRSSVLLGVLSLFLWPVWIVALVRNWNDPDTDIKWLFCIQFLLVGVMVWSAYKDMETVYYREVMAISDEDLAYWAEEDPAYAEEVRRERDALRQRFGWDGEAATDQEGGRLGEFIVSTLPQRGDRRPAPMAEEAPLEAFSEQTQRRLGYEAAASTLKFQRGTARFESARVALPLPQHFRFVPVDQLEAQARVRERELPPGTFGWIVHERVDMGLEEAWWIEVRFHADGHLGRTEGNLADAVGALPAGAQADEAALQPSWRNDWGVATWAEPRADGRFDVHAGLPLRHGLLRFEVPGNGPERLELALRAARLMAARCSVDRGWAWGNYRSGQDKSAGQTLAEWIAARIQASAAQAAQAAQGAMVVEQETAPESTLAPGEEPL